MSKDHEPLLPDDPERIAGYRLVGRVGQGGMGTVFLGEDAGGQRVAVKVIKADLAREESFRARFAREVQAARRVRRFCTAPVVDARVDEDPLFIVTEYVNGPTLEEMVTEQGPMPGSDLEGLAVGVATALTAIHGAGVVHRDLKPSNVLLSPVGPRVIDFGIARALDTLVEQTRTDLIVGTPGYLSPEVVRGGDITPACDVFAWGCVVAYAATGRLAFPGRTVDERIYRVAHDEPDTDGMEGDLRDLVELALDKQPTVRPAADELLARLVGSADPTDEKLRQTVRQATPHRDRDIPGRSPTQAMEQGELPTRADDGPVATRSRWHRWAIITGLGMALLLVATIAGVIAFTGDDGEAYTKTLPRGQKLQPGQAVQSENGKHKLRQNDDGELALYHGDRKRWSAPGTKGNPGAHTIFQGDGNLVVYKPDSKSLWAPPLSGGPGARLIVQDDGNVVLYTSAGSAIWSTNTAGG